MSEQTIDAESQAAKPLFDSDDYDRIRGEPAAAGVRFERSQADRPLAVAGKLMRQRRALS